ncbi:unnamed protein product [Didymodactylos carnosus]|uniref:Inosine/uridine-preferring nucleoside hydrolase domain-containing protein n=1 Tax=Didymodactylos carnosus TaxID=1234261 RepID=A0A814UNF0_9BILA|nr:unnamed protein product [Didymodactylos carnosus]CAF1175780.1 unnamed protein product [Didymodactylos carnosus]CAF3826700.1 unnamed protein product [Didymodactylos carnosus]CAF3939781.1 unnamed protein product [Didymodactylos carnosus]
MPLILQVLLFYCTLLFTLSSIPTIIETDIGSDYDDQFALIYLLSRPDLFDLKLVVVSTYNTTARGQIVAKTLAAFNRYDVTLALGRYTENNWPENNIWEYEWAKDYTLEEFQQHGGKVEYDGESALLQELLKSTTTNVYNFIQISPVTSLGHVLKQNSNLNLTNVRLFAMAGSIYQGYVNQTSADIEYNILNNIPGAQLMFKKKWKEFMLASLDCTKYFQFNGPIWQQFLNHSMSKLILDSFKIWYENGGKHLDTLQPYSPLFGTSALHDLLAVYLVINDRNTIISEELPLIITDQGYTIINKSTGMPVQTCLRFKTNESVNEIGAIILNTIINARSECTTIYVNIFLSVFSLFIGIIATFSQQYR